MVAALAASWIAVLRAIKLSILLLVFLFQTCDTTAYERGRSDGSLQFVWPVSGSDSVDLPQSSPFGPRQMASESFRYDYHRGVDIPISAGTELYAIADGVVRRAGLDVPGYSDGMVQITHTLSERSVYSTYLHLSAVNVTQGDTVSRGDVVGLSGASVSGFEHLHFEIRDGGYTQMYNVNPWGFLPFVDTASHIVEEVVVTETVAGKFNVSISVASADSPYELDFDRVLIVPLTAKSTSNSGGASDGDSTMSFSEYKAIAASSSLVSLASLGRINGSLGEFDVSFNTVNFENTPFENGSSDISILDDNHISTHSVVISPWRYDGRTDEYGKAGWNLTFYDLPLPLDACAFAVVTTDLAGNVQLSSDANQIQNCSSSVSFGAHSLHISMLMLGFFLAAVLCW